MANSTEYRVRVVFQTVLGNLESSTRRVVSDIRQIGPTGKNAGKEGSTGFKRISEAAEDTQEQIRKTETATTKFSGTLKNVLKAAVVGYAGKKIAEFGVAAAAEYGKTQKALGEMSSLGYKDLETLRGAAVDFSNTWSGTTREEFISAAYDIKSGIASLSDEGVAKFTELSGMTSKATKSSIDEMTSLFATGYGIYRQFYNNDDDFGEAFSAGIAKSVQQFKTKGSEMAASIESLGASASSANIPLDEQLSVLGMLQATMSGSEAGTKYKAFLQSAAKAGKALGLDFLDANNQLHSMPEILESLKSKYGDTVDAAEKMELTSAFGTEEAVALIDLFFPKIDTLRTNIDAVSDSIDGGTESVKTMASSMNEGILEKTTIIKQGWGNLLDKMGEQMEPGITPALDDIIEKLKEMQVSGDFTELGESMGKLVAEGAQLFSQLLDRAPGAISALASMLKWLADNLDTVAFAIKTVLTLWISFKSASAITGILDGVAGAFGRLTASTLHFRGVFVMLKTILKANLFGLVIAGIISLIMWFAKATAGVEGWKNKFKAALYDIELRFYKFVGKLTKLWQVFLGFFSKSLAKSWDKTIKDIDKKIADTQKKIDGMKGKDKKKDKKTENEDDDTDKPDGGDNPDYTDYRPEYPAPSDSPTNFSGSGASTPKTINDRIGDIEDKYDDEIENREIKADMATNQNQSQQARTFKEQTIELLNKQANDLLHLENNSSGNNRTIAENARLKILQKIQEITDDIRGGINSMVGEFNTPSDIKAMNKYQYLTSQGGTEGRIYYGNNNIEINLNTKAFGDASFERIKEQLFDLGITGMMATNNVGYDQAKKMADQVTRY